MGNGDWGLGINYDNEFVWTCGKYITFSNGEEVSIDSKYFYDDYYGERLGGCEGRLLNLYKYEGDILFVFLCYEYYDDGCGSHSIQLGCCKREIKYSDYLYLEHFGYYFDNNKHNNYEFYSLNSNEVIIIGNFNLNVINLFHWEIKTTISLSNDLVNNCIYLSDHFCFLTFLNKKISEQNEEFDIYMKNIKNKNSFIFKTSFNSEKGRIYYFKKDDNKCGLNLYFINVINNKIEFYCFVNIKKSIKIKNN